MNIKISLFCKIIILKGVCGDAHSTILDRATFNNYYFQCPKHQCSKYCRICKKSIGYGFAENSSGMQCCSKQKQDITLF